MTMRREAGAALLTYAAATVAANFLIAAPGGEYEPEKVARYLSQGHAPVAFAAAYLGCLASLALLVFGRVLRAELGARADLGWALAVAASTTGVAGWFVSGGVAVAMVEGGPAVRSGVPSPVLYTITELGNLVSWCAPALFIGVAALLLARVAGLPRWLRGLSVAGGGCGILAPFFFTFFVYVLWCLVLGCYLLAERSAVHQERPAARV